ncbi:carboxypeptidase-like regulatory domain-containing protein [Blastopirellula marina]|uniref:Carboxypeptidase regulatory-like domain-containing protein n=1 Tax=Blastopirellula marina TaxID=124 RepID=A0A2S8GGT0_9BACT|nr:carboxypeptidase-like regulatory domain-containing protein [Blastopirellula marina]PQO43481.1 carboxypeptidase regulatory-like domain-containing protein [Blastopirellula marina]
MPAISIWKKSSVVVLGAALFCWAGCSSRNDKWVAGRPPLFDAEGLVTINGEPLGEAVVTLHPVDGKYAAFARTDSDGAFRLTTFDDGDGAPAGEYDVTVTKMEIELEPNPENPDVLPPIYHSEQSMIPKKYGDLEKSGLTVAIVAEGANDLRLDLTGPPERKRVLTDNR